MKLIASLLLILGGVVVSLILAICTMIFGWGLEPKSWIVIIALGLFGQFFAGCMIAVGNHLNDD